MTNLELKSTNSLFTVHWGGLAYANDDPVASKVAEAMLLLKAFTGGMLAATGVTVLIASLLVSATLLLQGPAYVIELLAK